MDDWEIHYVYNGNRLDLAQGDTLAAALDAWRIEHPLIPHLAIYMVRISKTDNDAKADRSGLGR